MTTRKQATGERRMMADLGAAALPVLLAAVSFAATLAASLAPRAFLGVLPIWPANAIILAALMRVEPRGWAYLICGGMAGYLAASATLDLPTVPMLLLALAHLAEVLAAAGLLRRWCGSPIDLGSWRHLAIFGVIAGLIAPALSALIAAVPLNELEGTRLLPATMIWWAADSLGLLVVTPAILRFPDLRSLLNQVRSLRTLASLFALAAITTLVFVQTRYPLLFLVPPLLLLVATQLGSAGAIPALLVVTGLAVPLTLMGYGPLRLAAGGTTDQVLILQGFLAVCTFATLALATVEQKRTALRDALGAARDEARDQARRANAAEAAAGVGDWRFDVATGDLTCSDHVFKILGLDPTASLDFQRIQALIHPDDRDAAKTTLMCGLESGLGWTGALTRVVRPDGNLRYLVGTGMPEMAPSGRVVALVGTIRDATRETLADIAIRESEARYRVLADNVTDAITRSSLSGEFSYLSPAVRNLMGYSPEELLGRKADDLVHPDDLQILARVRAGRIEGRPNACGALEYRVRHKSGDWVWVEGNPTLVRDPQGTPQEFVDVIRDVTARKALEAELRAARATAEAALAVKADFLANMSHELRTPLTSILGFARMIDRQTDLGPETRDYINQVIVAGDALLSTVNDILDFSKLEAGQVSIRPQPWSPAGLAKAAVEMFSPQAAAKRLELRLDCEPVSELRVLLDPDRLRQIVLNLMGNAVKFTEAGSVTLRMRYTDQHLAIEVIDTGPGVPPDKLERLFLRFSQVNGSRTRTHEGTGLGLAICKGLVDAMGGDIGVESIAGAGSRFWLSIPAPVAEAAPDHAEVADEEPAGDGLRVLVVDDHRANRELARLFLDGAGVLISEAVDGFEAIEVAKREPFDAILMDISMPKLDGIAAAKQIRSQAGLNADTPVVAFTAAVDESSVERLTDDIFFGVVAKPIEPGLLISAVLAAASQGRQADDASRVPVAALRRQSGR